MSLGDINTGYWHAKYEDATPRVRSLVDNIWGDVRDRMKSAGFNISGDDAAEELVAAIMYYVTVSQE